MLAQIPLRDTFFNVTRHPGVANVVGTDVNTFISILLPNIIIVAGLIFFLLILGGGFMMIKSAGGEANPQSAAKARSAITFALIGFLLVVSAYFILELIKAITGVNFINPSIT
jgi:hypothetical protein